jgi:hypothetical protein
MRANRVNLVTISLLFAVNLSHTNCSVFPVIKVKTALVAWNKERVRSRFFNAHPYITRVDMTMLALVVSKTMELSSYEAVFVHAQDYLSINLALLKSARQQARS